MSVRWLREFVRRTATAPVVVAQETVEMAVVEPPIWALPLVHVEPVRAQPLVTTEGER